MRYSALAIATLIIAVTSFFYPGSLFANDNDESSGDAHVFGSITVCKVITDQNSVISDGSEHGGSFVLEPARESAVSAVNLSETIFTTPLTFNADMIGNDGENDAACVTYDHLQMGSYLYGEENITGDGWLTPLYNDQYTSPVQSISDFFPYDETIFVSDLGDSGMDTRNKNSDGLIKLTEEKPLRTLVILNRFIKDTPELLSAPYCGNGVVDQSWEQCDGGASCTAQCQSVTNECSENIYARIVVTSVANEESAANMTDHIYLGQGNSFIPSGTWFPLYQNGSYIEDTDINEYEDTPGLAVQRQQGSVIVEMYGNHAADADVIAFEHLEGYIELSNGQVSGIRNYDDSTGHGHLENWGPNMRDEKSMDASKDAAWIEGGKSYFWMGVTTGADGYYTDYVKTNSCTQNQPPVVTLLGAATTTITVGSTFTDPGATAEDPEDGNLTNIEITGTVNTAVPGTYILHYNVKDSKGLSAEEKVRTVVVSAAACSENISARIVITNVQNFFDSEEANMTNRIYLGQSEQSIASGEWFSVYTDNHYILDPDIDRYEDVPGLAVQRLEGKIRVRMYASHPDSPLPVPVEHVEGYIEFSNGRILNIQDDNDNDSFGQNKMENWGPNMRDEKTVGGSDAAWIENEKSFFWMTANIADDGYFTVYSGVSPFCINQPPVITLLGAATTTITVGSTFTDPGATAEDPEDGNLTNIEITGTVNTAVPGTYILHYNVKDSKGLSAEEKVRTVVVSAAACSENISARIVITNVQNLNGEDADMTDNIFVGQSTHPIASGTWFPVYENGAYILDLNIDGYEDVPGLAVQRMSGKIRVRMYASHPYTPSTPITTSPVMEHVEGYIEFLNGRVTDIQDDNVSLDQGDQNKMENWGPGMEEEKIVHPDKDAAWIEGGKSFFWFTATTGDDGYLTIYEALSCQNQPPVITLLGAATTTITVGSTFTDPGATAEDPEDGNLTNIEITGTVNTAVPGTYILHYNVKDSKGLSAEEKVRTVVVETGGGGGGGGGCTGSCGGGGGGAVLLPSSLRIYNETIEKTPISGIVLIRWQTNIPADSKVVYGTASVVTPDTTSVNYGYLTGTPVFSEATTTHIVAVAGLNPQNTYYFRPVSKTSIMPAYGRELALTQNECYYLREFIKFGANNNPEEVRKLQIFLNSFEGENLDVTGLYDEATLHAVRAFQAKYNTTVLRPWGYEDSTGYVYLTTRKQVNEIYCRAAFPLDEAQQNEVLSFRNLLESLKRYSIVPGSISTPTGEVLGISRIDESNMDESLSVTEGTTTAASAEELSSGVSSTNSEVLPVTRRSVLSSMMSAAYEGVSRFVTSYWLIMIFVLLLITLGTLMVRYYREE